MMNQMKIVPQDHSINDNANSIVEEDDGDSVLDDTEETQAQARNTALSVVVSQAVDVHNGNINNSCNHGDFGATTILERSVRLPPVVMRMPNT